MKQELLAELERTLIDISRMGDSNPRGTKQLKAHAKNVRNKLKSLRMGKEAWELERRYPCKSN